MVQQKLNRWVLQGREQILDVKADAPDVDLSSVAKESIESSIKITSDMPMYLRVAALDRNGLVLGLSEELDRKTGNSPSEIPGTVILIAVVTCLGYYLWKTRASIRDATGRIKKWKKLCQLTSRTCSFSPQGELRVKNEAVDDGYHEARVHNHERAAAYDAGDVSSREEAEPLYAQLDV